MFDFLKKIFKAKGPKEAKPVSPADGIATVNYSPQEPIMAPLASTSVQPEEPANNNVVDENNNMADGESGGHQDRQSLV